MTRGKHTTTARTHLRDIAAVAALALFALVLCLEFGRRGFMPLDHSITFDGGWRVLSGQVPYRDFTTPSGVVPIAIQAGLFAAFGVTWFAYCLHAALFNALFAALTYGTLRVAGEGRALSCLFGAAAAVVFYPGVGVPSHDHHSFAFGLLATFLLLAAGRQPTPRGRTLLWAGCAAALVLAVLSKHVPAGFLVPVLGIAGLGFARGERSRFLASFAAGGLATVALVAIAGLATGVDWSALRYAVLELPREEGAARLAHIRWSVHVVQGPRHYPTFALAPLGFVVAAIVAGISLLPSSRARAFGARLRDELPLLFLAAGLVATSMLFNAVTYNQPGYGLGYLPVSLGLAQLAWRRALRPSQDVPKGKKQPVSSTRSRLAMGIAVAAAVVTATEAYRFHGMWTANRRLNDFRKPPVTEDGARIAPAMAFLEFAMPEATADPSYGRYRAEHFGAVVDFFDRHPGNFFLLGDSSILYGLTGRPSLNPALWFHFGLTIPHPGTAEWNRYESQVLENMRRYDCRYVVVESKGTWMGTHIVHFPRLSRLLAEAARPPRQFGPFYVVPLDPDWASR